jgi:hypothetical protein
MSFLKLSIFLIMTITTLSAFADDGMFPMSELPRLNLAEKGIELTADQLFNPNHISLVDGICRVNGCTGSFVSANGLIITNVRRCSTGSRSCSRAPARAHRCGTDFRRQVVDYGPAHC